MALIIWRIRFKAGETPTEVGCALRVASEPLTYLPIGRKTPTGVGSTVTYHQIINVLFTTIARIHQPGHPIKNSLRDPP
jgi:hypothetical protein